MAWRSTALGAVFALGLTGAIATACSGGSAQTPAGSGDDVINDTRDSSVRATPNPDPGDDAGPDAMSTGPIYGEAGAAYPGLAECGDCTCAASKGYCFGGATVRAYEAFPNFTPLAAGDAGGGGGDGDGGLPACVMVDSGTPTLGCNPLPSGCADCACIIAKLQPAYSCYLDCASDGDGKPMTVYCPHY